MAFWNRLDCIWVPETVQPSLPLSELTTPSSVSLNLPAPQEVYQLLLQSEGNGSRADHPYGVSSLVLTFASLLSVSWWSVVCNSISTKAFLPSYRSIPPRQSTIRLHVLICLRSTAWPLVIPKKSGLMTGQECWRQTASVKIVLHFCHRPFRLCWSYGTGTITSVSILRAFAWLIVLYSSLQDAYRSATEKNSNINTQRTSISSKLHVWSIAPTSETWLRLIFWKAWWVFRQRIQFLMSMFWA